uniref:BTAD domain-containing putative transcriptional regulator n=1 Tax=Streptomyces xylophagus TaxID=285514 RepID=UPI001F2FED6D
MRCELRFGLLGTPVLYGRDDDSVHPIGGTKVRVLLAALLLEPGRVVSVDALKDALWGGSPPASAHASLHNHVTRLRRLLDDPDRLRAVPPGYVLRVDEGELDVHVFETQVATARTAHAARDWPVTLRACTAALALWRGTPLTGLPAELGGYAFAQRLTEARLLALEWRYDAELALGGVRLGGLVPELAALVADHPLREAYHRQLMLALHHTGRQAEALAVHRDLRNRLIEELGIEPGAGVRGAHAEVLRGVVDAGASGGARGAGSAGGDRSAGGATYVGGAGVSGDAGGVGGAGGDRSAGGATYAGGASGGGVSGGSTAGGARDIGSAGGDGSVGGAGAGGAVGADEPVTSGRGPGSVGSGPRPSGSAAGSVNSGPRSDDFGSGRTESVPGSADSPPGSVNAIPGPSGSAAGSVNSDPGSDDFGSGRTESVPGSADSPPGSINAIPGPIDSAPGPVNSAPRPADSAPGSTHPAPQHTPHSPPPLH